MSPDELYRLARKIIAHVASVDPDELDRGDSMSQVARSQLVDFAGEHGLDDQDFATLCRVHAGERIGQP